MDLKLAKVFDIRLTEKFGVYLFSSLPKCGDFVVDLNKQVILMRYGMEREFEDSEDLSVQLQDLYEYWKGVADTKGCPYREVNFEGLYNGN